MERQASGIQGNSKAQQSSLSLSLKDPVCSCFTLSPLSSAALGKAERLRETEPLVRDLNSG